MLTLRLHVYISARHEPLDWKILVPLLHSLPVRCVNGFYS